MSYFTKGHPLNGNSQGVAKMVSGYDAPIPKTPKVHGIEEGFTTPIVYASLIRNRVRVCVY